MEHDKKTNQQVIDDYDYLGKSCSFQECTGLIPFSPKDEGAFEAYEDIFPYLPPRIYGKTHN